MRFLKAFFLFFVLATTVAAQGTRKDDIASLNVGGFLAVSPNAAIRVCQSGATGVPCSPLANIYSDKALTQPLTNPFNADSNGNFFFYALASNYVIQVTPNGGSTYTQNDVTLPTLPSTVTTTFNFIAVPFSSSASFSFVPNSMFKMTLTGNVTSSSITGGPLPGATSAFSLCQDATGGRTFTFPANFVLPPSYTFLTSPTICNNLIALFDGTSWQVISSGAGGATASGPIGTIQSTNGFGVLTSSGAVDNGSVFSINRDLSVKGPNPSTDVRFFGAQSINSNAPPAIPGITATISTGSSTATISSASTFVNSVGVVIRGAGPNNSMSTPAAPTITPSDLSGTMGSWIDVNSPAGSTNYQYQCVAVDKLRGFTAASVAGTTSTGLTLGAQSVVITSISRSGFTSTVTTSAPHTLSAGAVVYIDTNVSDTSFSGFHVVVTVPDTTHFTFIDSYTTANGAVTSGTGGNLSWWTDNHVVCPAVTGTIWQYLIYGRTSGSMTLLGITRPLENIWDDFGPTISGGQAFPSWAPTTPPVSAKADDLVTTISSGGSTTTLTLANTASNSVSNATILIDDGPNLIAAAAAAGSNNPIYIPNSFVLLINSVTDISSFIHVPIVQGGVISAGDTLIVNPVTWTGIPGGNGQQAFAWTGVRQVIGGTAIPTVYMPTNGQTLIDGIGFYSYPGNGGLAMLVDSSGGGGEFQYSNVQWGTGQASNDYMGIGLAIRGGPIAQKFRTISLATTLNNSSTPIGPYAPSMYLRGDITGINEAPNFTMKDLLTGAKGIVKDMANAVFLGNNQVDIDFVYAQGLRTPLLTFVAQFGGLYGAVVRVSRWQNDTSFTTAVAQINTNFGQALTAISFEDISNFSGTLYNGILPPFGIHVDGVSGGSFGFNSNFDFGSSFSDQFAHVVGNGSLAYAMSPPGPITSAVVSAGGSVPLGSHFYFVAPVDVNGNLGPHGPSTTVNITSGNQTVTITPPASFPLGTIGYAVYRDGFFIHDATGPTGCFSLTSVFGTSATFVDNFSACGISFPAIQTGASQSISKAGVSGTTFNLIGGGFLSALSGSFTANRTVTLQDASGTIPFLGTVQTWTAAQAFNSFSGLATSLTANSFTQGSETQTALTHPPMNAFIPNALTAAGTVSTWTLDKAITVTRIQAQAAVAPSGCGTNAVIRLSDGTNNVNLTISATANDSGAITQNYAAAAVLTLTIQTAASGCTTSPGNLDATIQYRNQ